jgi:ribosomal protein S18 acetylase RimI-like enzyme
MQVIIRQALCSDAAALAQVHIDSWRTSYQGIIPADYLSNLSYKQRENQWARVLCDTANHEFVYVAQTETGEIAGFASGGALRTDIPPYTSELYAIYLLENYQKQGIGLQLFEAIKNRLLQNGFSSMLLWVLTENTIARRFYEARGGQVVKTQKFELGGVTLEETGYGWPHLTTAEH